MTVNVCLEEFCNIGKLPDFKRVLNFCRGSGIFCQLIVQSIPQLQDRYPKTEWEELIGCTDIQICLGCNDVDTATYISKKCGMVTIKVENNQMPLLPLFSPVYSSTRPYSQTKSNTQRPSCSRMKSCAWTIRRVWYFSEVKTAEALQDHAGRTPQLPASARC